MSDIVYTKDAVDASFVKFDGTYLVQAGIPIPNAGGGTSDNVNVRAYGAVGDGVTDDAAAFTAALAALPRGGTLAIPAGNYLFTSSVHITKPILVLGQVRSAGDSAYGSRITVTSGSVTPFTVDSDNVSFRELTIACTDTVANVTAGQNRGIQYNSGNYGGLDRLRIGGFYVGVHIETGYGWMFRDSYIVNQVKYGLLIRDVGNVDAGDPVLSGMQFDADMSTYIPDAAIRYESGGGLKIADSKIIHHTIGLDLAIADGAVTQDLLVCNTSLEGQVVNAIRLGRAGTTGIFRYVLIDNVQIDGGGPVVDAIRLNAGVSNVSVKNCIIYGSSSCTGIHAYGGDGGGDFFTIANNHFVSCGVGIQVEPGVYGIDIGQQSYANVSIMLVNNIDAGHASGHVHGTYSRDIGVISTTTGYANLWRVDIPDAAAATIEVVATGILNGVGGFLGRWHKSAYRASGGAAVTLADITAPVTVGGPFGVQFDTATQAGSGGVIIGLQKGAGGSSLVGHIEIRVSGVFQRIIKM